MPATVSAPLFGQKLLDIDVQANGFERVSLAEKGRRTMIPMLAVKEQRKNVEKAEKKQ
jgi:hypothetical protein